MYMVLNPSVQKYVSIDQYPNASKITTMSEYSSDSVEKVSIEEMKKYINNILQQYCPYIKKIIYSNNVEII